MQAVYLGSSLSWGTWFSFNASSCSISIAFFSLAINKNVGVNHDLTDSKIQSSALFNEGVIKILV